MRNFQRKSYKKHLSTNNNLKMSSKKNETILMVKIVKWHSQSHFQCYLKINVLPNIIIRIFNLSMKNSPWYRCKTFYIQEKTNFFVLSLVW